MSKQLHILTITLAMIPALTNARVATRACQAQAQPVTAEAIHVRPIHKVYHKKLACLYENELNLYGPIVQAYRKTRTVPAVDYPRALDELRERVVEAVQIQFSPCCRGGFISAILSLLFLGPIIYFFIVLPIERLCQQNATLSPIGEFCAYHVPRTLSRLNRELKRAVGSPISLEVEGFMYQLEDTARLLVATSL